MKHYFHSVPDVDVYASGRLSREMVAHSSRGDGLLKKVIWAYFLLLIVEGALRKWFLPGLATPLLIVRDPVAFVIIVMAWQRGLFPVTAYLYGMIIIGTIGLFTASLLGHGNLWVALYGARILLLHFPVMFAIGRVFTREDVLKMGNVILWMAIPLALLITVQFFSSQSAWVNRGVGGDVEGAGFAGAMGYFRPSATFSFTNGTTLFFGLVAPFVIYFWFNRESVNRMILIGATISLLLAIPLSISRALAFGSVISFLFMIIGKSRKPKDMYRIIPATLGILLLLSLLFQVEGFQKAVEVFTSRFESANEVEGGLQGVFLDRYLGGMIGALSESSQLPFFGFGLGLGTNVGSMLTRGEVVYLISEGEWGRMIGELGPLMGLLAIGIRIGLTMKIAFASYSKLVKGDFLPWMLLSVGLFVLPQSQWAQPTTLGFSTLIGGLMLASLRVSIVETDHIKAKASTPDNINRV